MSTTPAPLSWDEAANRIYETGVDRGVLFVVGASGYGEGKAWNGLINVTEKPTGAEVEALYADNMKYLELVSKEEFEATIEAYTYPEEFDACEGIVSPSTGVYLSQQARSTFGFSYRTKIGNAVNDELGYKIHLVYGAKAKPTERARETVNDSPAAATFSWDCTTTPVAVSGYKPTAHLVIDSRKADATKLASFEKILYGSATEGSATGANSRLPLPAEVISHFATTTSD